MSQVVKLKNGSEEVAGLVTATMMSLQELFRTDPMTAYDLVEKCRKPNYQPFGNAPAILQKWCLMQPDGNIHDSIKNVVLSAVSGEGLNMVLESPLAPA